MSCTWVDLSEDGTQVQLVSSERAKQCELLGSTTVSVLDNVGPVARKKSKVREELERLAKNEAALMEGNALTSTTDVSNGMQSFDVYRCNP